MAELGVSQPLEQRDGQTDSRSENNAADCIRIEWEAGRYLGKKVAAEKEEETSCGLPGLIERLGGGSGAEG